MTDPLLKRGMKLALLAIGVMACLGLVGTFLSINLQSLTWGMALGVLLSITMVLGSWWWKRRKPVAPPKPLSGTRQGNMQTVAGFGAALLCLLLIQFSAEHVGWFVAGAAVGLLAMVGVVMSPLFWVLAAHAPPRE